MLTTICKKCGNELKGKCSYCFKIKKVKKYKRPRQSQKPKWAKKKWAEMFEAQDFWLKNMR